MPRALTEELERLVTESGHIVPRVDIVDEDFDIKLSSEENKRMHVVGGSITTDEAANIVGHGEITLLVNDDTREEVIPLVRTDPLSPVAESLVYVQFHAPDDEALTAYGIYDVTDTTIDETSRGTFLTLQIADNSRRVERAQFWRPERIAKGTLYVDAFSTLLNPVLPGFADIEVVENTAKTAALSFDVQDSRIEAVNSLANALGYRIDWNHNGRGDVLFTPDEIGDLTDQEAQWSMRLGDNARLIDASRFLSDERTYNGVVALGESTGSDKPPVRAEVWDKNPHSPTYFDPAKPDESVFGPHPFFYVSEFITTTKQALAAASARLPKVVGMSEVLTLSARANPGIIPGDSVLVEEIEVPVGVTTQSVTVEDLANRTLRTGRVFIVEQVEMPLRAAPMRIRCRERRLFI